MSRVEIAGDPGSEALRIDGHPLPFTSATLELPDRGMPVLTVTLPVAGRAVVTLEAAAAVAGPTHAALVAMGWTPPPSRPASGDGARGFMAGVTEDWLDKPPGQARVRMVHEPTGEAATGISAAGDMAAARRHAIRALGERLVARGVTTVNGARAAMGLEPWPQDAAVPPVWPPLP